MSRVSIAIAEPWLHRSSVCRSTRGCLEPAHYWRRLASRYKWPTDSVLKPASHKFLDLQRLHLVRASRQNASEDEQLHNDLPQLNLVLIRGRSRLAFLSTSAVTGEI